jgi:hypothetical protein
MTMLFVVPVVFVFSAFAADQEKDENRLENSGTVLAEELRERLLQRAHTKTHTLEMARA